MNKIYNVKDKLPNVECGDTKSISLFYTHKKMTDGHLGKCIECTKKDTKKRTDILVNDSEWHKSENARQREKYYRLCYKEKYKQTNEKRIISMEAYFKKFPEKKGARNKCSNLKPKEQAIICIIGVIMKNIKKTLLN